MSAAACLRALRALEGSAEEARWLLTAISVHVAEDEHGCAGEALLCSTQGATDVGEGAAPHTGIVEAIIRQHNFANDVDVCEGERLAVWVKQVPELGGFST